MSDQTILPSERDTISVAPAVVTTLPATGRELDEVLNALTDEDLNDLFEMILGMARTPVTERTAVRSAAIIASFLARERQIGVSLYYTIAIHPDQPGLSKRTRAFVARCNRVAGTAFKRAIRVTADGTLDWESARVEQVRIASAVLAASRVQIRLTVDRTDGESLLLEMPSASAIRLLRNYARDLARTLAEVEGDAFASKDVRGLRESVDSIYEMLKEVPPPGAPPHEQGDPASAGARAESG